MVTQSKESQSNLTSNDVIQVLKEGNKRFLAKKPSR